MNSNQQEKDDKEYTYLAVLIVTMCLISFFIGIVFCNISWKNDLADSGYAEFYKTNPNNLGWKWRMFKIQNNLNSEEK